MTLKEILNKGYSVRINHYRRVFDGRDPKTGKIKWIYLRPLDIRANKLTDRLIPKGGITYVTVRNGTEVWRHKEVCSNSDMFCYRRGVEEALKHMFK